MCLLQMNKEAVKITTLILIIIKKMNMFRGHSHQTTVANIDALNFTTFQKHSEMLLTYYF